MVSKWPNIGSNKSVCLTFLEKIIGKMKSVSPRVDLLT